MPIEAESMFQRLGDLELPVRTADIGASGLSALDPSRDLLLELFASAVNSELSEAWAAVVASSGKVLASTPVADTLPGEPTEQILRTRVSGFPLLALHRVGTANYEEITLEITRLKQQWALHYILGPLDVIDARQMKDVCVAVAKIVALVVRQRGHRSFQSGALQFFGSNAPDEPSPITSLKILSHEGPGQAVFAGNESSITYWAIEIRLETTELSSYVDGSESLLDAADIAVGVGGGEGLIPSLVLGQTDADPSL